MKNARDWSIVIKPKSGWFNINLKELWQYNDLVFMFLKRNFNSAYKQTVLGPLWFLISPIMSSGMFTLIFGKIANISTDGVPQFLFYLCSNTAWGYFATCLTSTAGTFTGNAGLFGKVYFPRLVVPVTNVIYALLSFFINIFVLIVSMLIYTANGAELNPNGAIALVPLMVLQMALFGLGLGIIISSVTTKYRDLSILVGFGMQLWMYATPVVYPVSQVMRLGEDVSKWIMLNPVAPIINNFRYAILGCGSMDYTYWGISWIVTVVILFFGIIVFNRVEKTFMDTV